MIFKKKLNKIKFWTARKELDLKDSKFKTSGLEENWSTQ